MQEVVARFENVFPQRVVGYFMEGRYVALSDSRASW